jgi:hypothetical protein
VDQVVVGGPAREQPQQPARVRCALAHRDVGPVGAPQEPVRVGIQQDIVVGPQILEPGYAADRELDPGLAGVHQLDEPPERRVVDAARRVDVCQVIEHERHP